MSGGEGGKMSTPPAPAPYRNDSGSARVIGPGVEVFYNQDSEADRWVPALNAAHAAGVQSMQADNDRLRAALRGLLTEYESLVHDEYDGTGIPFDERMERAAPARAALGDQS